MDRPIEDGLKPRTSFRDGALWGSLLVFLLLEGPPADPELLANPDDLELKIDELKEVSLAPKDIGPLCDASAGCPTAPS